MNRTTLYAVLFVLCLGGLAATFVFGDAFKYNNLGSFQIGGISYNSANGTKGIFRHQESARGDLKTFELSLDFNASSINHFNNVFQTAPANSGLRLELSKPGTVALIAAARNSAGFIPYIVAPNVSLNRWHSFDVKIDPDKHITVTLDGQPRINETNLTLAYEISDIAIGTGMSETRPFDGQIRNASISYRIIEPSGNGSIIGVRTALAAGAVIFLFLLSLRRRREIVDVDDSSPQ